MSQITVIHNKNDEEGEFFFDNNGFIARPASLGREVPRGYDVTYLGYNGDGHIGRVNLTTSAYFAFGESDPGVFVDEEVDIEAAFFLEIIVFLLSRVILLTRRLLWHHQRIIALILKAFENYN